MSGTREQLELLKEKIAERIKGINSRRLHYRSQAFYAFISTAALASVTTILLGLNLDDPWKERIRIAALVITTIITLINTYNAFFNHKELWVANNSALNRFYELQFDIEFFEKGSMPLELIAVDEFKKRYQAILNELNQTWYKSRGEGNSNNN